MAARQENLSFGQSFFITQCGGKVKNPFSETYGECARCARKSHLPQSSPVDGSFAESFGPFPEASAKGKGEEVGFGKRGRVFWCHFCERYFCWECLKAHED